METTISVSFTYPTTEIERIADAMGYSEYVHDPNDDTQTIENPESRVEFFTRMQKTQLIENMITVDQHAIRTQKRLEADALIADKRALIDKAITSL